MALKKQKAEKGKLLGACEFPVRRLLNFVHPEGKSETGMAPRHYLDRTRNMWPGRKDSANEEIKAVIAKLNSALATKRLLWLEKISYGVADMGFNFYWTNIAIFPKLFHKLDAKMLAQIQVDLAERKAASPVTPKP
jgi:hypothetical protein